MAKRKTPEKSKLQLRAERCSERFRANPRRPIVIEFAGLPKAGKTTTLGQVQAFLKRCGFRVEVVIERASVCPIRDKRHANFSVWTACTTLAQILEHTQMPGGPEDPDILILDRGLFDSICWLAAMERLSRIRHADRKAIDQFLLLEDWCNRITGVILMTASPADALGRERGYLPVVGRGGSIMNEKVLASMKDVLDEMSEKLAKNFEIFKVNTSTKAFGTPQKSCEAVATKVLEWIDGQLQEDILTLPESKIKKAFRGKPCIGPVDAKNLVEFFCTHGEYPPRSEVERDTRRVQALPIVIVKNKKGEVLRLRRKEKQEGRPLDKKIVIWAGGHVRKEDQEDGSPILHCAVRELEEELRLSVEPKSLVLKGAIHSKVDEGTSKHIALVYEWKAQTDDVEVALSNAEFYERTGNALSGTFISWDEILSEHDKGELTEEWSSQIVKNLTSETAGKAKRDLFDIVD